MRIAIIGCGGIARAHCRGYRAHGAEIVALVDAQREAALALGVELGLDADCCVDRLEELWQHRPDALSICTPPACHADPACAALAEGVHVLCEKPLAHDTADARRMCAAASASGALLMTAFRHRFLPVMRRARALLDDDAIGAPVLLQNSFFGPAEQLAETWFGKRAMAGGGTLMDTSIHAVDLSRLLCGEVRSARAGMAAHLRGEVEDASIMLLEHESGALASLAAGWTAGVGRAELRVIGRRGALTYDYRQGESLLLERRDGADERIPVEQSDGFAEQVAHFLGAIQGEHELESDGGNGLRALELVQGCYRSEPAPVGA